MDKERIKEINLILEKSYSAGLSDSGIEFDQFWKQRDSRLENLFMKNHMNEINAEMFEQIIIFSLSEPGAMGPNGHMTFLNKSGKHFTVDYTYEGTSYQKIKELFPELRAYRWFGPMKSEMLAAPTIVIGGSADEPETKVAEGWKHIYLDYGNHLAVKEEYYSEVKKLFLDKENRDITFYWPEMIVSSNFIARLDDIELAYHEQKVKDEKIAKALEELKGNPEYIRRIKENSDGNVETLMKIFQEFSGIEIDFLELKQFAFRQLGCI